MIPRGVSVRVSLRSSAEGGGFVPPSSGDFELPPIFGDNVYTTKPIALVFLSVILVSVFFILSSVPRLPASAQHQYSVAQQAQAASQ